MSKRILAIDCETTLNNVGEDSVGSMKANPFHPENKVVWWGWRYFSPHETPHELLETDICTATYAGFRFAVAGCVVGHNIKFDLHYLWKHSPIDKNIMEDNGVRIWDTQLAEYLLTGQQSKWATLDELSEKYGGTLKPSKIKEYWDAGVGTEDIPEEEILPYLKGDVNNTALIYIKQVERAKELGMLPLIESQMEALLATTEMEWNGMHFDVGYAIDVVDELLEDYELVVKRLVKFMHYCGVKNPNPSSNQQIAAVLFGGVLKNKEDVAVVDEEGKEVRYKSGKNKGKIKTRKVEVEYVVDRRIKPFSKWATKTGWSVSDDVLKEVKDLIVDSVPSLDPVAFVLDVLEYRKLQKDISTYFVGYSKLTWSDGIIHHKLNHCQTNTGRLSSSKPNLQNVSGKE